MLYYDIKKANWFDFPLKEGVHWTPDFKSSSITRFDKSSIREDLLEDIESLGLEFREVLLFSVLPLPYKMVIHIDGHDNGDNAAINWVKTESKDWTMNWYQHNGSDSEKDITVSTQDTLYIGFPDHECTLIGKHTWKDLPCLVRVDIPHTVQINDNHPRICASMRFKSNNFDHLLEKLTN